MPPPRKIDRVPDELRRWLDDALKKAGFGEYDRITDELNDKLEEEGMDLRLGKSAVHAHGKRYAEFIETQRQAAAWASDFASEAGVETEAGMHGILVQRLMAEGFKLLDKDEDFTAKDLASFSKMLSGLMSSSNTRERILDKERDRIREEEREAAAENAEKTAVKAGMTAERAAQLRRDVLGVG